MKKLIKRQIDFWGSLIGLIILAIPFIVISIIIKLDSKGSVFFRQERAGKNGKVFKIYKFRTMIEKAEKTGLGYNVAKNVERITKFG